MMQQCLDSFNIIFSDFETMFNYHENQSKNSTWYRTEIHKLQVAPLDKTSPLYGALTKFALNVQRQPANTRSKRAQEMCRRNVQLYINKEGYIKMYDEYPDLVTVEQLQKMLNVRRNTAYMD
jgi:hypothetical protein